MSISSSPKENEKFLHLKAGDSDEIISLERSFFKKIQENGKMFGWNSQYIFDIMDIIDEDENLEINRVNYESLSLVIRAMQYFSTLPEITKNDLSLPLIEKSGFNLLKFRRFKKNHFELQKFYRIFKDPESFTRESLRLCGSTSFAKESPIKNNFGLLMDSIYCSHFLGIPTVTLFLVLCLSYFKILKYPSSFDDLLGEWENKKFLWDSTSLGGETSLKRESSPLLPENEDFSLERENFEKLCLEDCE